MMRRSTTSPNVLSSRHLAAALLLVVAGLAGGVARSEQAGAAASLLPVRGFCIAAPLPDGVDAFIEFIEQELVPASINTLVLRVDYNFEYQSHPKLRDAVTLNEKQVRRIVKVCRRNGIRVIPQINLLGHQSWEEKVTGLLRVYPEFDETPHIAMPENYVWPNPEGLYCKSYCPLHPQVHAVVFSLIDELLEAFEADAFHAGMDEVFYIADDKCPRCAGRDPAELFAGEVTAIRNHLASRGAELWIWGDRLIDGKTTGIGMWEASMNNTHRAIDLIPKDVVIADWHYERADPTAHYFAVKGFKVVSCPWQFGEVASDHIRATLDARRTSTPEMRERFAGVMQTVWTDAAPFLDQYYGRVPPDRERGDPIACCKRYLAELKSLAAQP
jgi:hypothetical protein